MSVLIIHQRDALFLYTTDSDAPVSVPLPKEAVTDLEVNDEVLYMRSVAQKLGKGPVNQSTPAILVIPDDLCYVMRTSLEQQEDQTKQFISGLPFSHVEIASIHSQKDVFVVATNGDLYETAVRAVAACGYIVSLVVPWNAITQAKLSQAGEIDRVTVKRIFDAQSQLKSVSFPMMEREKPAAAPTSPNPKTQKPISRGWILFGSLALIYVIGMMWFMLRK